MADAPDEVYQALLSPSTRLVLVLLWRHSDSTGKAVWPSVRKIASITRQSTRSVHRQLAELEKMGWTRRVGVTTNGVVKRRLVRSPLTGESVLTAESAVTSEASPPMTDQARPPARSVTSGLTDESPKPPREPTKNPPPRTSHGKTVSISPTLERGSPRDEQARTVLERLEATRADLERESGTRIGRLSRKGSETLDGLTAAIEDHGVDVVLAVTEHRIRSVISGSRKPQLWRFLFRGNGFSAALEEWQTQQQRQLRRREAIQSPEIDDAEQMPFDRLAALADEAQKGFGARQ